MRSNALALTLSLPTCLLLSCVTDPGASSDGGNTSTGTGGRVSASGGTGATGTGGQDSGGSGGAFGGGGSGGSIGSGGGVGAGGGTATGGGSGGRVGTGGAVGTGGRIGTGGAGTGGSGTGGAQATSCNLPNHSGSGSFTFYYFGQGTARDGSGYRTACGYQGTEGGTTNVPGRNGAPTDSIPVLSSISAMNAMYFAAIPGQNGFDTKNSCGACIQVTGQNGRSVIATIVDECPYGSDGGNQPCRDNPSGALDLSTALFGQLGYSVGNPGGTTWKFVPCPITGNVIMQVKSGNNNEFFVQNTVLAIKGVSRGGENAVHQSYGAWHFGTLLNVGDTLTLTDALNRTLQIQVKSTAMGQNQDTGVQFAPCL